MIKKTQAQAYNMGRTGQIDHLSPVRRHQFWRINLHNRVKMDAYDDLCFKGSRAIVGPCPSPRKTFRPCPTLPIFYNFK